MGNAIVGCTILITRCSHRDVLCLGDRLQLDVGSTDYCWIN
jgi:hypothetical protein